MASSTRQSIYEAIASIRLIDPHTHINPHAPASKTLADLLGYHYYTELAHSAGMPKARIEEPGISPHELVGRLVANLEPIENTAQYRWLVEICRKFFHFTGDRIDRSNWEEVYAVAESEMAGAQWSQMVLDQSNVEAVFLTNDFDDDLSGFDTDTYIPCLRTDDLVFHLTKPQTRQRLAACAGFELDGSLRSLRLSLRQRFDHFISRGARACAISLPPSFQPTRISDGRAATALDHVLRNGVSSDPSHQSALSQRIFWTLAELCDEFGLPFDLMIGVNRSVYPAGVFQGQDLYDSRVSLIQYAELFNAFPDVKFPVSVLASVTNQELVSYSWIFPNVITNGHWWYSNTPSFIAKDAAARLEAVPQTKQIAYYSDAYKLEFVWPKFDMYRNVLAGILADHFVEGCGWSEERAIELGQRVLRDNVDEIFPKPDNPTGLTQTDSQSETWIEEESEGDDADDQPTTIHVATGTSSALAAGAIGMIEVGDAADDDGELDSIIFDDDSMPTTIDEPGTTETVRIDDEDEEVTGDDFVEEVTGDDFVEDLGDDFMAGLERSESDDSDQPSAAADTVRIEEFELDPLPNHDEIQAVDLDDVTVDDATGRSDEITADRIDAESDPEAIDVGEIWGDETVSNEAAGIEMLEGKASFIPDEESLQAAPHPETGELTLPLPESDDDELLQTIDLDDDDDEITFDLIEDPEEPKE